MVAHRPECELVLVPKVGLCTCDHAKRLEAARHALRQKQDQENADGMLVSVIASLGC